jgi:F0F1-type ATP synthase membrane subunit b/b'
MNERETYIDSVLKDIVAAENQFEDLTHQIQAQENAVRDEAFKQKEQLEATGSQQAAEIMASTRQEINALRAEAQKEVDAQISAARKHVQKESESLAKHIIETVLYRSRQS